MATRLEQTLEMIRAGLQEEARRQLERNGHVNTGFLRDNTKVSISENASLGQLNFIVEFPDYGVFIDQGTEFIDPSPFYSNLVIGGEAEGVYEDEIEEMLEEAFNQDVEELDNNTNI